MYGIWLQVNFNWEQTIWAVIFVLRLPWSFPFGLLFFLWHEYNRVWADPDRKRTAFNNRHLTLQGASVWFHCLRQSCLNITRTPPVPWQEAQSHCLRSSYFYWQQENWGDGGGCEFGCGSVCMRCMTSKSSSWQRVASLVRVLCFCIHTLKCGVVYPPSPIGWVVLNQIISLQLFYLRGQALLLKICPQTEQERHCQDLSLEGWLDSLITTQLICSKLSNFNRLINQGCSPADENTST